MSFNVNIHSKFYHCSQKAERENITQLNQLWITSMKTANKKEKSIDLIM